MYRHIEGHGLIGKKMKRLKIAAMNVKLNVYPFLYKYLYIFSHYSNYSSII